MLRGRESTGTTETSSRFRARRLAPIFLIALIAAAAIAGALIILSRHQLMVLAAPDRMTYDWRTALFSRTEPQTRKDIGLVLIGDRSLARYPYQLPMDRGLLAQIVRTLDAAGAKAIGFDIIFDRPTDKDDILIDAIKTSKTPVVLGAIDSRLTGIEPENLAFQREFFEKIGNPRIGHVYFHQQHRGINLPDLVIRDLPPLSDDPPQPDDNPNDIRQSFAEALVMASGREVRHVGQRIAWLESRADNGSEAFNVIEIPPHRPQDLTSDVILPPEFGNPVKDKIIIVGGNFEDRDRHLTPMSIVDGVRSPGALIHAQIVAQLIDGRSLTGLTNSQEFSVAFLLALIGFFGGRWFRFKDYEVFVYGAGVLALVGVGIWLFKSESVILPSDTTFYSLIAGIAVGHNSQRLARRFAWSRKQA
jgi:adenylate cyclase